ncbi:MAG: cyclic nucleotide-binding domain-containing protein [Candidatus Latescibacterota bacterium]|nr:MAG: cyclic nucleotide-binding domain-containing protein [Candidatus Latescibacterota bacterium]
MESAPLGREYSDGEVICRQGEEGDRMFVIQDGQAEVTFREEDAEYVVGQLGVGDLFGEMAVFDKQPRSATVRAKGRARILTLDKHGFLQRVQEDPSFVFRILQMMSSRIRHLDAEVARLRRLVSERDVPAS